jgi:hypothetical protein
MQVSAVLSFDEYWGHPSFVHKRPRLDGSLKAAYGDNIYHRDSQGEWIQENSHHSLPNGAINQLNSTSDTSADRVLVSDNYSYWGKDAIAIPDESNAGPSVVHPGVGHSCHFPSDFVARVDSWLQAQPGLGFSGRPADW